MSLTGLSQVIGHIQSQSNWRQRTQFLQISQAWSEIVGASVAGQTRPTGIYQQVLQVAVSSSVWSQALSFERVRILAKLNDRLAIAPAILDIHFSTAKWASKPKQLQRQDLAEELKRHPSYLAVTTPQSAPVKPPQDPLEAFDRWSVLIKQRSSELPKCDRCGCPSPQGEIARWKMCRACASQHLFKS
jgi:predicted nucleic acid-binding Zn ribbon protein